MVLYYLFAPEALTHKKGLIESTTARTEIDTGGIEFRFKPAGSYTELCAAPRHNVECLHCACSHKRMPKT